MIFPISTGVNSGTGDLNLKIVASPIQPISEPNLIWVNTTTPMTSWVISAETPSSPTAGMIWINIIWSSVLALNVFKQNGLTIRPVSSFQYIDSTWVEKECYYCYDYIDYSEWINFSYTYHPLINGTWTSQYIINGEPTVSGYWNGSALYMTSNDVTNKKSWRFTKSVWIDATKTSLIVQATQTSNGNRYRRVGIRTDSEAVSSATDFAAYMSITSNGTHTLSLTEVNAGHYYIAGYVEGYGDPSTGVKYACSLTVTDIQIV